MILSINPSYYCNFRCDFCYLTENQLSDKKLLSLNDLEKNIIEIISSTKIDMVDIYGGESGLLTKEYWNSLIELLQNYGIYDINVITNLSMINHVTTDDRVYTSVSYDFDCRESHELVWKNMALLNKPFSILMLCSPKLIKKDVVQMICFFNTLNNLESVEIKPYSKNQSNQLEVSYLDYEEFVKKWITSNNKKFEFVNEKLLEKVLSNKKNSFSDDHVYITPNGKYGVLEFDLNDNEFFLELDSLDEYYDWCKKEKVRVTKNKYCSNCDYYGKCLSEHLREVKNIDKSCNGFKKLIDWYDERMEIKARNLS
jgi:organic radical activating enzyme